MKKTNKKGFTLVELLVVIAILAILATVAVVGYTSFTEKAHESNDRTLVAQLNTAVLRTDGKYTSMHEVAEAVKAQGFDVAKMQATAKNHEILWNMDTQKFFYSADDDAKGENVWIVSEEINKVYSTYYIGAPEITSDTTTSICVVTNGEKLVIDVPNADVYHYGKASSVVVKAVKNASYHVYAEVVGNIEVQSGHVVVEQGAVAPTVIVTATETGKVTVDVKATEKTTVAATNADVAAELETKAEGSVEIVKDAVNPENLSKFAGGLGTEANPYLIANAEQFANIATVTLEKAYYALAADITVSETVSDVKNQYIVFDLNGYTLNSTTYAFGTAQKIEVFNGTVNLNGNAALVNTLGKEAEVNANFNNLVITGTVDTTAAHYGPVVCYAFTLDNYPATIVIDNVISNVNVNNSGTSSYSGGLLGYAGGSKLYLTVSNSKFNGQIISPFAAGIAGGCTSPKAGITVTNVEMNGIVIGSSEAKAFGGNGNMIGGNDNCNAINASIKVPATAIVAKATLDASLLTGAKDLAANGEFIITHSNDAVEYYSVSLMFWVTSNYDLENGYNSGYPRSFQVEIEVTDATSYNTGIYKSKVVQVDADNSTDENRIAVQNGVTIWYADNTYYVYSANYTIATSMNVSIIAYGYDADNIPVVYATYGYANK